MALYFTRDIATVLFFIIPCLILGLVGITYILGEKRANGRLGKICTYIIHPIVLKPIQAAIHEAPLIKQKTRIFFQQMARRVLFLAIFAGLFLLSATSSVFFHESGHGFMGLLFGYEDFNITIFSPFSGVTAWYNTIPGDFISPLVAETWLRLAGGLFECIMGCLFMSFLLLPFVRKSFWGSEMVYLMGITGLFAGTQYWLAKTVQYILGTSYPSDDVTKFFNTQQSAGFIQAPLIAVIILVGATVLVHVVAWKSQRSIWTKFYPPDTVSIMGVGLLVSGAAFVYLILYLLF